MTTTNKPTITIHNTQTGEIVNRQMNDDEVMQFEADKAIEIVRQNQAKANATQKAALLAKLGITEEEAKLLLS